MIKELLRGLKWVLISLFALAVVVSLWVGCAWSIGWAINHYYDLKNFGPNNFLSFGSCALVFTLVVQAITIILTGWVLISYGRSHGMIGKK